MSRFAEPPRKLDEAGFVQCFGGVYEHSPWIAHQLWQQGLDEQHDTVDGLANALAQIVDSAGQDRQLTLIQAHPDLAGRAAVAGELTADSTGEQHSAGIDQCSPEEFSRFQQLNDTYKAKFGFPFVMAVKGSDRHAILAAFEQRLHNSPADEFQRAITEIHKIARLRLTALAG